MEDVTDSVFRQVIIRAGRPDLMFTEFTNCDGLNSEGHDSVVHRLKYLPIEKPLIAQIWGKTPKNYYDSARIILNLGFDGVDINMGCPEKNVIKNGCCSALLKNQSLAQEIIQATREGAQGKIPVSVKTRIGFNTIDTESWFDFLLDQNLAAIGVHGRTVKEKSKVPCHWDEIAKVSIIRNQKKSPTIIYGNGDVSTLEEAQEKSLLYGLDGIMIGRGVFHNPWLFSGKSIESASINDRLELLLYHLQLWDTTWDNQKHYPKLKKYFKIYLQKFQRCQRT
ncbi:MAG: tRNA-dihydrouridine synthase family protein [Thermales bacterium]|nr:tRNA-dihydrouridine synthase family protein [Thermales bacterium]